VHLRTPQRAAGYLELAKAKVRWFLSISAEDLPKDDGKAKTTWRSIKIDGSELEFSDGFTDLHTESYKEILAGRGFGLDDVRPSVEIASALRQAPVEWRKGERHPSAREGMT
jgi:UDP-N-acetyl-2-amino-2-deoxyglucuronate dehydrogenase